MSLLPIYELSVAAQAGLARCAVVRGVLFIAKYLWLAANLFNPQRSPRIWVRGTLSQPNGRTLNEMHRETSAAALSFSTHACLRFAKNCRHGER
jgi:hypothetical protein